MPARTSSSASSVGENDVPLPSKSQRKVGFLGAKKPKVKKKKYETVIHKKNTMKEEEDDEEKALNTIRQHMSVIRERNLQLEMSLVKQNRERLELAILGEDIKFMSMDFNSIEDQFLREHFQAEKSRVLRRRREALEHKKVGDEFEDVGASGKTLWQQISDIREQNHQLEMSLLKQKRRKLELDLFEDDTKILSMDLNSMDDLVLRGLYRAGQARILQRREEIKRKIKERVDASGDVGASGGLT